MQLSYFKIYKWGISTRIITKNWVWFVFKLGHSYLINQDVYGYDFIFCWPQKLPTEALKTFKGLYWTKITSRGIEHAINSEKR